MLLTGNMFIPESQAVTTNQKKQLKTVQPVSFCTWRQELHLARSPRKKMDDKGRQYKAKLECDLLFKKEEEEEKDGPPPCFYSVLFAQ